MFTIVKTLFINIQARIKENFLINVKDYNQLKKKLIKHNDFNGEDSSKMFERTLWSSTTFWSQFKRNNVYRKIF